MHNKDGTIPGAPESDTRRTIDNLEFGGQVFGQATVGEATDARHVGRLRVPVNGILLDMVRSEATLALP